MYRNGEWKTLLRLLAFLPGDMGATKAKEEEVETPLGIRLDDEIGGDSCILVWMGERMRGLLRKT